MLTTISFHHDYFPVMIMLGIAWSIPTLMNLLKIKRIPTVIVEIIAGFFIGRLFMSGFSEQGVQSLEFLALSGFIFLMFQSGLEIDINKILLEFPKKKLRQLNVLTNPLLLGVLVFAATLVLSYLSAWGLSLILPISNKWYFSLILVTTSVGVILPVLKNRGEISSRFGQTLVLGAAIADILSIILFTFTAFIIRHGFQFELLLILILFAAFYLFYYIGVRIRKRTLVRKLIYELSHAASQIQVRGTVLLILIFVVLSQSLGEEVILLGAFLSGVLLSSFVNKERSLLILKLDGMGYGFFIPIFFIMVGAQFDPSAMQQLDNSLYIFVFLMLLILYGVKIIPGLLLSKQFGVRKALSAGFLMASRLSLIIAASKIGLDLGVITPGVNAVFLLMAVVTCLVSPVIYNQINPVSYSRADKVIIVGGSSTSVLLSRRLAMHGKHAVIVENNLKRYHELESKGFQVILGDGQDVHTYERLALSVNNYIVVLTESDDKNYQISRVLKEHFKHEKIITKSYNERMEELLKFLEVEFLDVTRVLATTLENYILRPTAYHALVESFENFSIEEMRITNNAYNGAKVKDIPFHHDASILLYKRGDSMELPNGDTVLRRGDTLFAFGTTSALRDTREKFTMSGVS